MLSVQHQQINAHTLSTHTTNTHSHTHTLTPPPAPDPQLQARLLSQHQPELLRVLLVLFINPLLSESHTAVGASLMSRLLEVTHRLTNSAQQVGG